MLTYFVPDSYLIADNVIFLVITDKSYPRKLAFSYLDELSKEFQLSYGAKVDTVRKPYAFVGFGMYPSDCAVSGRSPLTLVCADTFMSKTTRLYQDTRTASAAGASHLDKLNDELQDVTRIMTKNMEELLWRGDSLDSECAPLSGRRVPGNIRDVVRNVSFVHLSTVRVRKVSPGGAEYQLPGDATAVCPHRRRRVPTDYIHLVAVLMRMGFYGLA